MARYKPGTREATRQRIVDEASRQFREKGVESTSIADIMGALDLTVGGFYKHFESKAALLRESLGYALDQASTRLARATDAIDDNQRLSTLARIYLTPEHRENVATGCPIAALTNDIARADEATRQQFQEQLLAYLDSMVDGSETVTRDEQWQTLATLVGGLLIARSVVDEDLANEIMDACKMRFDKREHVAAVGGRTSR